MEEMFYIRTADLAFMAALCRAAKRGLAADGYLIELAAWVAYSRRKEVVWC